MTFRPATRSDPALLLRTGENELAVEILAEKANALERAGRKAERALAELRAAGPDEERRPALVKTAADAMHGYFIQRELMGFRSHAEVVERLAPPRAVLAKIGAR